MRLIIGLPLLLSAAASALSLWPEPASVVAGGPAAVLSPTFALTVAGPTNGVLAAAITRYSSLIALGAPPLTPSNGSVSPGAPLAALAITLRSSSVELALNTSEAYELDVAAASATLVADTVYGALRGLETFAQLVEFRPELKLASPFIASAARIVDAPRFAHRGALVDTSRHFIALPTLFAFIDALAWHKMNVFHWHLTDDESFPFVSAAFPALAARGAYNAPAATHTYSPADVAALIAFARDRGVRVVPEFDTPGHTLSWGAGQAGLLTPCYTNGTADGTFGPVDPSREATFDFLRAFFADVVGVFPDAYLHIGGDEVSFTCWASNPQIAAWMRGMGWAAGNYTAVESYFVQRVIGIIADLNRSVIGWEELFDNKLSLPPDTLVSVWKYHNWPMSSPPPPPGAMTWQKELYNVTKAGYRSLLSSPWYLNVISYGIDWPTFYSADPLAFNGTAEQRALVLGGEVTFWGEYIDSTNLLSRAWPRASAVAERLWSPESVTDIVSATARIGDQRCRLIARSLPAGPLQPGYCPTEITAPPWPPA